MTTLHRVLVGWSGIGVVGTAVNVLHFSASDNPAPPVAALRAAFAARADLLSANTQLTFPSSGDTIEDTTGELTGVWSVAAQANVAGLGTGNCVAGVGGCIGWQTGGIINGRRLKGRTFIAPLDAAAYDTDGTLKGSHLTSLQALAAGIMASGPLAVWHRPTSAGAADGNSYGVVSARVRDKVAFLSSRRD